MAKTLKSAVAQCCNADAQCVINCCEKCGIKLSSQEKAALAKCDLQSFSDARLAECFSPKCCNMLGIAKDFSCDPKKMQK